MVDARSDCYMSGAVFIFPEQPERRLESYFLHNGRDQIIVNNKGNPVFFENLASAFHAFAMVPTAFRNDGAKPGMEPDWYLDVPHALRVILGETPNESSNLLDVLNFGLDLHNQFKISFDAATIGAVEQLANYCTFDYGYPEELVSVRKVIHDFTFGIFNTVLQRAEII